MKIKTALFISIVALLSPVFAILIMLFVEPEFMEAIFGGLIIGCAVGGALGVVSLILNKGKNRLVSTLSIIPMCPLVLYLLLLILYLISK